MAKKKIDELEENFEGLGTLVSSRSSAGDLDDLEDFGDDSYSPDDLGDEAREFNLDEETISNSLQLAHVTAQPSDVAKHYNEMPKEVKLAFLNDRDVNETRHRGRNYRNFDYIKKILELQKIEDDKLINNRKEIFSIKSKQELKEYFILNKKYYLYKQLEEYELIDQIVNYIPTMRNSGFHEDLQAMSDEMDDIYDEYNELHEKEDYVDDAGQLGEIISTAVTSSGKDGNERNALITSIQATKDVQVQKEQREKARFSLGSLGKVINKFN